MTDAIGTTTFAYHDNGKPQCSDIYTSRRAISTPVSTGAPPDVHVENVAEVFAGNDAAAFSVLTRAKIQIDISIWRRISGFDLSTLGMATTATIRPQKTSEMYVFENCLGTGWNPH